MSSNPLFWVDPFGLAQFGTRPLGGGKDSPKYANRSPAADWLNIELKHEQLFFDDGKQPSNQGFFGDNGMWKKPGVVREDDPANVPFYRRRGPVFDDDIMREAIDRVGTPKNYCIIGSNCQSWSDKVRDEYEKIKRERKKPCP